jgi:hypothetical protein
MVIKDLRSEYIWVTPDPDRVKRFIAICEAGRARECYLGERWYVHKSQLNFLRNIGFFQTDGMVKVFDTWKEAEQAPDAYKITVRQ